MTNFNQTAVLIWMISGIFGYYFGQTDGALLSVGITMVCSLIVDLIDLVQKK